MAFQEFSGEVSQPVRRRLRVYHMQSPSFFGRAVHPSQSLATTPAMMSRSSVDGANAAIGAFRSRQLQQGAAFRAAVAWGDNAQGRINANAHVARFATTGMEGGAAYRARLRHIAHAITTWPTVMSPPRTDPNQEFLSRDWKARGTTATTWKKY